ncbi:MAG: hypothetical protein CMJ58_16845 [Planctomycetaceae bacterium]|nr:hypothetical protein [Planctomycetaceae bacterium]
MKLIEKQLVVRVLAETDVLWTPLRFNDVGAEAAAAIVERRSQFRERGLLLAIGGAQADRQQARRVILKLEADGLLCLRGRGKKRSVCLTRRGDDFARSFCPTLRIDESWHLLERVGRLHAEFGTAKHLLEQDILGIRDWDDATPLLELEDLALPLLCAGLLDACGDTEGRVGYRVTNAGRKALLRMKPAPPIELPKPDANARKKFNELYVRGLDERRRWRSTRPSHVVIPASAGDWPCRRETPCV